MTKRSNIITKIALALAFIVGMTGCATVQESGEGMELTQVVYDSSQPFALVDVKSRYSSGSTFQGFICTFTNTGNKPCSVDWKRSSIKSKNGKPWLIYTDDAPDSVFVRRTWGLGYYKWLARPLPKGASKFSEGDTWETRIEPKGAVSMNVTSCEQVYRIEVKSTLFADDSDTYIKGLKSPATMRLCIVRGDETQFVTVKIVR